MSWQGCKNILCIRPDNMGDLIMTGPAIRALKETFGVKITILTSSMAKGIIKHMPEIDDAIILDLPWVKNTATTNGENINEVVAVIKQKKFDAAVIFTVYSQNPLPTAMLAYLAGIPKVLAYCRENPYNLITDWVPDKEPYHIIKHQVARDIDLVANVGAFTNSNSLYLRVDEGLWLSVKEKMVAKGIDFKKPWLLVHPGVSENKRRYPLNKWAEAARSIINKKGYQIILTGSSTEKKLTDELAYLIGEGSVSTGGIFNLAEFICLVKHAPGMLSVNTGTVHIAAAVGTPVIVLYAQTNPQHTPWHVKNKILPFPVSTRLQSKNEVIGYVNNSLYKKVMPMPTANDIIRAMDELFNPTNALTPPFPEIPDKNLVIAAS